MPKKVVGKIYHTKHGQPYKILPSGKARFIKKTKKGGSILSSGKKVVSRAASYVKSHGIRGGSASIGGGLKKRKRGGSAAITG